MSSFTGRISAVGSVALGSALEADAPAGATFLAVEEPADFDEAGGTVVLRGGADVESPAAPDVVVEYTSADDGMSTLTLAEPLATAWGAGTRVEVWDNELGKPLTETIAMVSADGDDAGDSLEAIVDHSLIGYLPEGIRAVDPVSGITGEAVALEYRGADLFVVDILGKSPLLNGDVLDPDTVPEPRPPSEPEAPAAPQVLGSIGSLLVRWDAITHPNPVVYEVHASDTTPVVPSAETLVTEISGTQATIRRLPKPDVAQGLDYTLLNYSTVYHVAILAKDATDETFTSGLGPEGSGTPVQATAGDLAADSVTAEQIVANSITGENLAGEVILGSKITTATAGQRVEFDVDGIRLHASDDTVLIDLPTAVGEEPTFRGTVNADGLTVRRGAAFYSEMNRFERDSVIYLAEQVGGPTSGPGATMYWPVAAEPERYLQDGLIGEFGLVPGQIATAAYDYSNGGFLLVQHRSAGSRIWFYNADGTPNVGANPGNSGAYWDWPDRTVTGVARRSDGDMLVLEKVNELDTYFMRTWANNLVNLSGIYPAWSNPVLGFNGTNVYTADRNVSSGRIRFRILSVGSSSVSVASTLDPSGLSMPEAMPAFVYYGEGDWSGNRWVVSHRDSNIFRVYNTSGTQLDDDHGWRSPVSKGGAFWNPSDSRFYTMGSDGFLYRHTAMIWASATFNTWHVGQTFLDTNPTGGTHESGIGAVRSFTMAKRAAVRFTLADVPYAGGTDDPNGWALYVKRGAPPALDFSDMWRQATGDAVTLTASLTDFPVTSGTPAPQFGTFPGASPASLRSERVNGSSLPSFEVRGDGSGRWGNMAVSATGAVTAVANSNVAITLTGAGAAGNESRAWSAMGLQGAYFRFRADGVSSGSSIGTMPTGYRPPWTWNIPLTSNAAAPTNAILQIATNGAMTLTWVGGTPPANYWLAGSATWPVLPA